MATLSQIEHCFSAFSSDTKSMIPIYFFNFTTSTSRPGMKNFQCGKITKDLFFLMGMLLSNEDPHFVTIKKKRNLFMNLWRPKLVLSELHYNCNWFAH